VTLRYALPPMSAEETSSYVGHHLSLRGRSDTLFSDDALSSIHQAGRGLPRAVNNLARQALVTACANRSAIVDEKATRQAITEVDAE
jgi:type II secretory pathway predicted ATPase ExeA